MSMQVQEMNQDNFNNTNNNNSQNFDIQSQQNTQNQNKTLMKSKNKLKKPDYVREMNVQDKLENQKIIKNMNKRINFLRNPRYAVIRKPIEFNQADSQNLRVNVNDAQCPFRASPEQVLFKDYMINQVYEIPLVITNVQKISRRFKFLPPSTDQFTVTNIKFPQAPPRAVYQEDKNKEFGVIAPGMCVELSVTFNATSFAEFEDKLTVICDENVFDIPIYAKKEPPQINLPELLDCKSCWLGDKAEMVFKIKNKGGEAGFKFFCENEEDDNKQQEGDALKLNNFTIYPAEFFIEKNKEIEIFVTYFPSTDGICQEKIILACDNQTSATYTLQGKANTAELAIHGIDGKPYNSTDEIDLKAAQKIFFENAVPNKEIVRTLEIENKTQVNVKYHWSLFKDDKNQNNLTINNNEDFFFKIEPENGHFEPEQIISFKITYLTDDYIPIFEFANLFIDDIPYSSIRNLPESLHEQLQEEKRQIELGRNQEQQIKQPAYFGVNSVRPFISYFDIEMIGLSQLCKVQVNPSFYSFPQKLYINKEYTHTFQLQNISKCPITYKIRENKTTSWEVDSIIPIQEGVIEADSTQDVVVGFKSKKVQNNQKISFSVDFNYANTISLDLIGDFIGPHIQIIDSEINFGLFKSFSTKTQNLNIKNTSDIDTEVTFYLESEKVDENGITQREDSDDPEDYIWENAYNKDIEKEKTAIIKFIPKSLLLSPGEEAQVQVYCESQNPQSHTDIARIAVKDGDNQYMNIKAEIQDIHVSLSRYSFDFDCLFAGNSYSFEKGKDEQFIELQNLGNLPANFKWENIDNEVYSATFEPKEGEIPPKCYFPIKFTLVPKLGGSFDQIFVCDILEKQDQPLGFEIQSNVLGLSVEFEKIQFQALPDSNTSLSINKKVPGSGKFKSKFLTKTMQKSKMSNTQHSNKNNDTLNTSAGGGGGQNEKPYKSQPLEKIDFFGCQINQVKTMDICIRNTSGIDTQYLIYPEKYLPKRDNYEQKFEDIQIKQNMTSNSQGTNQFNTTGQSKVKFSNNTSINKYTGTKQKKTLRPTKPQTLLTAEIEQRNNFTSVQGQQVNAGKRLEKDQRLYLSNNMGIAILCEPYRGRLPAYGEAIVKISCFNDICGLFDDTLCCEIKGMPVKKFDISIEVKGTPLIIKPNQLGINYKEDFPLYHLGYYMRNSQIVSREFRIENTGPKEIEIEWKVYNLDEDEESSKDRAYFNIEVGPPNLGSKEIATLNFNSIPLPEAKDGPFIIDTSKQIVSGRKDRTYKVQFSSDIEKCFNAVIIAVPKLIENPDVKVGMLAMYFRAETIQPMLHFDKYLTVEGTHKLKFEKWALVDNKKESKQIALINQKKSNVIFKIEIFGPFKIVFTQSNSPAKYELLDKSTQQLSSSKGMQKLPSITNVNKSLKSSTIIQQQAINTAFNLVPSSNVEIKIQFEGPDIKDYEHWPMIEKEYKFGGLTIFYSNGDEQHIDLEGRLLRPAIQLNTVGHEDFIGEDVQDFGLVHINNKKTISVYLSNKTKIPARWKLHNVKIHAYKNISDMTQTINEKENLQKVDEPDVFEFSISQGVLYGPSVPVKSLPDTSALPNIKTNQDISRDNLFPQQILINFRPKKNILYKSKFRIVVDEGPYVDLVVKGMGTYEENLEI